MDDKAAITRLNRNASTFFYTPYALLILAFFSTVNLILVPFVYIYQLYYKIVTTLGACCAPKARRVNSDNKVNICSKVGNLFLWLFFGIPMLMLS